jgi:hypothetical protein
MNAFRCQMFTLWFLVGYVVTGCGTSPVVEMGSGPQVLSMSPSPEQSYFSSVQGFRVTFSEAMDLASVETNYRVTVAGKPVVGTFHWKDDASVMVFESEAVADSENNFEVWFGQGMRSRRGQPLLNTDGQACNTFAFGCVSYGTPSTFETNGQRIYFTRSSASNLPIVPSVATETPVAQTSYGGMGYYGHGRGMMQGVGTLNAQMGMACVNCHGPDGKGGKYLGMGTVLTPDIRYSTLTEPADDGAHAHEAYTDEALKHAITTGVKPDGDPLNILMPRWSMSDGDLSDLIGFLKTL